MAALSDVSFVHIDDPAGRWGTKRVESWGHRAILEAGYHVPQSREVSSLNLKS